jgi:methylated-DNA-[protein]-cysteine S-methyltransferase
MIKADWQYRSSEPMTTEWHDTSVFKTPWGWMGLAASDQGISSIVLPTASRSLVKAKLGALNGRPKTSFARVSPVETRLLRDARQQLTEYLAGNRRAVDFPVTLEGRSAFERRVWRAILRIPYGRVRSYKWVASRIGGAHYARAVGRALGANPVPIIVPCHRVVAHDASLGGFSGGLDVKRRLLRLEGVLSQLKRRRS